MKNKLQKWFTAAADAEPIIKSEEVGGILNNLPNKVAVKSKSKLIANISTVLFLAFVLVYLMDIPRDTSILVGIKSNQIGKKGSTDIKSSDEEPEHQEAKGSVKIIELHCESNDSVVSIDDLLIKNDPIMLFTTKLGVPSVDSVITVTVDNYYDRIIRLSENELKKIGIKLNNGAYNHYYKTYANEGEIKATQLVSRNDSFYFTEGYPGKNYFIKSWESDYYPLYVTDSLGNQQQNFHFQDCPLNMDSLDFVDSLRKEFLRSYADLIPIAISSPKSGKLNLLWYKATADFYRRLPRRAQELIDIDRLLNGSKLDR